MTLVLLERGLKWVEAVDAMFDAMTPESNGPIELVAEENRCMLEVLAELRRIRYLTRTTPTEEVPHTDTQSWKREGMSIYAWGGSYLAVEPTEWLAKGQVPKTVPPHYKALVEYGKLKGWWK